MLNRLRNADARLWWLVVAAILLLSLALILGANIQRSSAESQPLTYRTATVGRGDIEASVKAPGVLGVRSANLTFQASGVISDVLVQRGAVVKAGQPLAKLDSREAEALLSAAVADQKKAQSRVDTVQNGPARDLLTAQSNLKVAQAQLDKVKSSNAKPDELTAAQAAVDAAVYRYNAIVTKTSQSEKNAAEAALRQAKAKLDQLNAKPTDAALREAQARVTSTTQNWEKVKINTADAVKQAELALQKAQVTRDAAKDAYDKIRQELYNSDGTPKKPLSDADKAREKQAKLALDQAELDLQAKQQTLDAAKGQQDTAVKEAEAQMIEAQAALEKLQEGPAQQDLLAAQAAVDKAQADYDKLLAGPNQDEVNAAQAEINQARANLDKLNQGGTEKDILVAQAEVDKYQQQIQDLSKGPVASELSEAQGGLEKATAQVKQAQVRLEQTVLLAPYNSVVESVNVAPGQTISSGPVAFSLVDLSSLTVDARVSETSIQQIKIGQAVRMTFEGISGVRSEPFKGKVTFVSFLPKENQPVFSVPTPKTGTVTPVAASGSVYPVNILLDRDPDIQTLKPGMNGKVQIALESKTGVLLVPKIAIRTLEPGPVVDVVLPDGQIVATPITTGLSNDDYIEVLENGLLREGDMIILHGDAVVPPLPTYTPVTTGTGTPAGSPGLSPTPGTPGTIPATPVPSATPSTGSATTTPTIINLTPNPQPGGRIAPITDNATAVGARP